MSAVGKRREEGEELGKGRRGRGNGSGREKREWGEVLKEGQGRGKMIEDYPRRKSLAWVGSTWLDQSLEQGVRDFKKSLARD